MLHLLQLSCFSLVDEAGELVLVEDKPSVGSLLADAVRGSRSILGVRLGGGDFGLLTRLSVLLSLLSTHVDYSITNGEMVSVEEDERRKEQHFLSFLETQNSFFFFFFFLEFFE